MYKSNVENNFPESFHENHHHRSTDQTPYYGEPSYICTYI